MLAAQNTVVANLDSCTADNIKVLSYTQFNNVMKRGDVCG
jgi:hypothetical protein